MAVTTEPVAVAYVGNNSTVTLYPVPWKFWVKADLAVYVDGVAYDTFFLDGTGEEGGGGINTASAIAATSTVVIAPNHAATQPNVFVEGMATPQRTIEDSLDRIASAVAAVKNSVTQTLKVPAGETAPAFPTADVRAGTVFAFSDTGAIEVLSVAQLAAAVIAEFGSTPTPDRSTHTCADATARAALAPEFTGQILVQLDDYSGWVASGLTAGDWVPSAGQAVTADATTLAALAPAFVGQLLVQLDDSSVHVATGLTAGDWT